MQPPHMQIVLRMPLLPSLKPAKANKHVTATKFTKKTLGAKILCLSYPSMTHFTWNWSPTLPWNLEYCPYNEHVIIDSQCRLYRTWQEMLTYHRLQGIGPSQTSWKERIITWALTSIHRTHLTWTRYHYMDIRSNQALSWRYWWSKDVRELSHSFTRHANLLLCGAWFENLMSGFVWSMIMCNLPRTLHKYRPLRSARLSVLRKWDYHGVPLQKTIHKSINTG